MGKNKLTIKVDTDTTEALKQMKEVTEAANECVTALEKLEKVMNRFKGETKPTEIKVDTLIGRKEIVESIFDKMPSSISAKLL